MSSIWKINLHLITSFSAVKVEDELEKVITYTAITGELLWKYG